MNRYFFRTHSIGRKKRIFSLILAWIILMGTCLQPGFVSRAEEDDSSEETVQQDTRAKTSTLDEIQSLLNLDGVFTVDNIVLAGIEDKNFAQSIYDSIRDNRNNFRSGIRVKASGDMNKWNARKTLTAQEVIDAGKEEGIIPDPSRQQVDPASAVRLILSYFTGYIDATHYKEDEEGNVITDEENTIRSIVGIKLLRRAVAIDLTYNSITDITELERGNGYVEGLDVSGDAQKDTYFGEPYRNVRIYLAQNNILRYFKESDGRLNLDLMNSNSQAYIVAPDIVYLIKGDQEEKENGIRTGFIPINVMIGGIPIALNSYGITYSKNSSSIKDAETVEDDQGTVPDTYAKIAFTGIRTSGSIVMGFIGTNEFKIHSTGENLIHLDEQINFSDSTVRGYKTVKIQPYTSVSADAESKGIIHLKKLDEKGKAVPDAVFELYKCKSAGETEDQLVATVETDENGDWYQGNLDDGTYYFVETGIPKGYTLNATKEDVAAADENGMLSFAKEADSYYSLYKCEGIRTIPGEGDKLIQKGLKSDAAGNVNCTGLAANENYYLVKNEAFEIKTVKNDNWTLSNGEKDTKAGDSLETNDGSIDESGASITKTETIQDGFFVKAGSTENINLSVNDTDTSPLNEIRLTWTAGLQKTGEEGEMTYRIKQKIATNPVSDTVTYLDNKEELIDTVQAEIQKLSREEYRNVTVEMRFGGEYVSADRWQGNQDAVKTVTVTNPKSATLRVYKQDDSENPLEGAEFTLYREYNPTVDNEADKKTLQLGENNSVDVVAEKVITTKLTENQKKAEAVFDKLPLNTTWYLAETKLPTGYEYIKKEEANGSASASAVKAIGKIYTVTISATGKVSIDEKAANQLSDVKNEYSITMTNIGISLPTTGYDGGYDVCTVLGMVLIAGAVSWLYLNKRKKQVR